MQLEDHVKDKCAESEVPCPFKTVGNGCQFKASCNHDGDLMCSVNENENSQHKLQPI